MTKRIARGGGGHIEFEDTDIANNTRVQENSTKARGWLILLDGCTSEDLWKAALAAQDSTIATLPTDASTNGYPARFESTTGGQPDNNLSKAMLHTDGYSRTIYFKRDILIKSNNLADVCTDINIVMENGAMFIIDKTDPDADAYFKNWRIGIRDRHEATPSTSRSIQGQPWLVTQYSDDDITATGVGKGHDSNGTRLATLDGCTITNMGNRQVKPNIGVKHVSNLTMAKSNLEDSAETNKIQEFNILGIRANGEFYDVNLRNTQRVRGAANNVRVIIHNLTTTSTIGSIISSFKRSSLMINNWDRTKLNSSLPNMLTVETGTPDTSTAENWRIFLLGTAAQYFPDSSQKITVRGNDVQQRFEVISGALHYMQVFKDGSIFTDYNVAYLEDDNIIDSLPTTDHGEMLDAQDNTNPHAEGKFAYVSRAMRRHHNNTNWVNTPITGQKLRIRHATISHIEVKLTDMVDGTAKYLISEGRSGDNGFYIPIAVSQDPDYTGDTDPAPSWGTLTVDWATKTLTIPFSGDTTFTLQDIYNWFKQELSKPANLDKEVTATRVGSKLDMAGWRISLSEQSTGDVTILGTNKFDAIELREPFVTGTITTDIRPTVLTTTGVTVRYTRNAEDAHGMAKITPPLPADNDGVNEASYINLGASGSIECAIDQAYHIVMKVDGCYEMAADFDTTDTFSIHYNFTRIPPIDLDALADLDGQVDNDNQLVLDDSDAQDGSGNERISTTFDSDNGAITIHGGSATKGIDLERNIKLSMRLIDYAMRSRAGLDFYDVYLRLPTGTDDSVTGSRLTGSPLHGHAMEYEGDLMHIDDRVLVDNSDRNLIVRRVNFKKASPSTTRVRFGVPMFGRMSGTMERDNRYIAPIVAGKGTLIFDNVATIVQNVITGGGGGATAQEIWEYAATNLSANTTTVGGLIRESLDGSIDAVNDNVLAVKRRTDKTWFSDEPNAPDGASRLRIYERELWDVPANLIDANGIGHDINVMATQWPDFRTAYTDARAALIGTGSGGMGGGASAADIWSYPIASITGMNTVGTAIKDYLNSPLDDIDSVVDNISNAVGVVIQHLSNDSAFNTPITIHKRVKDALAILNKIRFVGTADSTGTQRIEARAQLYGDQLSTLDLTTQISGLTADQARYLEAMYGAIITNDTIFHNPNITFTFDVAGVSIQDDNELLAVGETGTTRAGTALYTVSHDGIYEAFSTAIGEAVGGITKIDNTVYGIADADRNHIKSFDISDPSTLTSVVDTGAAAYATRHGIPATGPIYGLTHVNNDLYWLYNNTSSVFLSNLRAVEPPVTAHAIYQDPENGGPYYIIDEIGTVYRYTSSSTRSAWDTNFSVSTGITDAIGIGVNSSHIYILKSTGEIKVLRLDTGAEVTNTTIHTSARATGFYTRGSFVFHSNDAYTACAIETTPVLTSYYVQFVHLDDSIRRRRILLGVGGRPLGIGMTHYDISEDDGGFVMILKRSGSTYSVDTWEADFGVSDYSITSSADYFGNSIGTANGIPQLVVNTSAGGSRSFSILTATTIGGREIPQRLSDIGNVKMFHDGTNLYAMSTTHLYTINDSTGAVTQTERLARDTGDQVNVFGSVPSTWDFAIYGGVMYIASGGNVVRTYDTTASGTYTGTRYLQRVITRLPTTSFTDATTINAIGVSTHNSQNLLLLVDGTTLRAYDLDNSNTKLNNDTTIPAGVLSITTRGGTLYLLMTDGTIQQWTFDTSASDGDPLYTRTALTSFPDLGSHDAVYGIATNGDHAYVAFDPSDHNTTLISTFDLANAQPTYILFKFDTTAAASNDLATLNPVRYNVALPHTTVVNNNAHIANDGTNLYASLNGTVYKLGLTGERVGEQLGILTTEAQADSPIIVWRDALWEYNATDDIFTVLQSLNIRRGDGTNRLKTIQDKTDPLRFSSGNLHTDVYAVAGDGVTGLEDFKGFRSDDSTALEAIKNDAKLTRQILANKYTFTADTPAAGQTTLKIFADDGTTVLKEIVIEASGDRTAATDPDA